MLTRKKIVIPLQEHERYNFIALWWNVMTRFEFGDFLLLLSKVHVRFIMKYKRILKINLVPCSVYRTSHLIDKCRSSLELFFAIWFVMGNVWAFDSRFGSFPQAPKLQVLCIILLSWNAICYSFPFLLFLLLCCCVPLMSTLLGYNMSMGSSARGASEDQISQLPSWRYKGVHTNLDLGNDSQSSERLINQDPVSDTATYHTQNQ